MIFRKKKPIGVELLVVIVSWSFTDGLAAVNVTRDVEKNAIGAELLEKGCAATFTVSAKDNRPLRDTLMVVEFPCEMLRIALAGTTEKSGPKTCTPIDVERLSKPLIAWMVTM